MRPSSGATAIPVVQHLAGVGANLQDHTAFCCIWEYREALSPRNNGSEAKLYWKTRPDLESPNLLFCPAEFPVPSVPAQGWTMFAGLARPSSRGKLRLTGADPSSAIDIDANMLSDPADMDSALACIEICRELGNARAFQLWSPAKRYRAPSRARR